MRSFLLVLIIVSGLVVVGCRLYHPTTKIEYHVPEFASVAEGKRLTMLMCGSCHYNSSTNDFSGRRLEDSPALFGKVYSANITQDSIRGIGSYTEAQLAYLIRTGVSKSGKIMPYMQRPNLADEDLQAIIAFLRSNDPSVKPSKRVPGKTSYTPIGKLAMSTVKPLQYEQHMTVSKPLINGVRLGEYLVDNLACFHCHSKSFTKLNILEPGKSAGFMGGGNRLKDAEGKTIRTPNLTPHETGIKNWSLADFKRAITEGISKDNSFVTYPMPLFPELTDGEVESMYLYLHTLSPIDNEHPRVVASKNKNPSGEALYRKFQCISCHGSKGTSPFDLTDSKMAYTYDDLKRYIDDPGAFGNLKMPSFKTTISEKEYKELTRYVIKLKNDSEHDK